MFKIIPSELSNGSKTFTGIDMRGRFIQSYSISEVLFNDLLAMCLNHPHYKDLGKYPYPEAKRDELLSRLLKKNDGFINGYVDRLRILRNRFNNLRVYRAFYAHAIMVDYTDNGIQFYEFRMIAVPGGSVKNGVLAQNVETFEKFIDCADRLADEMMGIMEEITSAMAVELEKVADMHPKDEEIKIYPKPEDC